MSTNRTSDVSASRREFLKASTVAAGAAIAANLAVTQHAHAAGGDLIKVGLIGCGGRGTGAADNLLEAAQLSKSNVKLWAMGDVFKDRAEGSRNTIKKKGGEQFDVPDDRLFVGLDAYEKVINSGVDLVILATPPGFRPIHLQAAVAAGKHIFAEKPVAVDGPGARKCLDAYEQAKAKKLCIVAGTQRRHQLGYLETMKRIQEGAIGDIVAARAYWNGNGIWFHDRKPGMSDVAYQCSNWYHFLWTCGDHICEQHVHNLDVINWALNAHPVECTGMGGRSNRKAGDPNVVGQIFDHFSIEYVYPNNVYVQSFCRQIANCVDHVGENLVGTKGTCDPGAYKINGKRILTREQDQQAINPYVQEHIDLLTCIREGKPINELKQVTESTLTAIMGRMATYTGKRVTWEKALNSMDDTYPQNLAWDMSLPVGPVPSPGKTPLL